MRDKLKDYKYCLYGCFIVLIIYIFLFILQGIFPFGEKLFMYGDYKYQYLPFIKEFRNLFHGEGNLFISWLNGSGTDFFANYTYYMSSPLNFIFIFIPENLIPQILSLLTIIRVCLMTFTCGFFIKKVLNINNWSTTVFSLIYSFCGFSTIYVYNIIWLDSLILYPILLYFFFKMLNHNKYLGYFVTLTITIWCNFYMATIIGLSILILFLLVNKWKDKKIALNNLKNIALYSSLAIILNAIIIIPSLIVLFGSVVADSKNSLFLFFDNIFETLKNFYMFSTPKYAVIDFEYAPIYMSIGLLFIFPQFFNIKTVSKSMKIKIGIVAFLLIFGMDFGPLNLLFHFFHLPVGIPNRYIWITVLLFIFCGAFTINNKQNMDKSRSNFIAIISSLLLIICLLWTDLFLSIKIINIVLICIYTILWLFPVKRILCTLIAIEVCLSGFCYLYGLQPFSLKEVDELQSKVSQLQINENQQMAFQYIDMTNVGNYIGMKNFNGFSSMLHSSYTNLPKLGIGIEKNRIEILGITPFTMELFGIRYIIPSSVEINIPGLILEEGFFEDKKIEDYRKYYLYENDDNTSMIHILPKEIKNINIENDYFFNINNISKVLLNNNDNIYTPVNAEYTTESRTIEDEGYGLLENIKQKIELPDIGTYAFLPEVKASNLSLESFSEEEYQISYSAYAPYYSQVSFYKTLSNEVECNVSYYLEEHMNLKINNDEQKLREPFKFAKYNQELEEELTNKISTMRVKDVKFKDNSIFVENVSSGILTVGTLYSPGWKVFIDGKSADTIALFDNLLAVDVPEGTHNVEFRYITPGFIPGIIISTITLITIIFLTKKKILFYN